MHRALVTAVPDPGLEDRQRQHKLSRLAEIEAQLTDDDKQKIAKQALRLKAEQDAKPDLATLPTLELSDIPMKFEDVPSRDEAGKQAKAEVSPQPTNGITYLDLRSDFSVLTAQQQDLLPLFSRVLTQSGAAGQDYVKIAARIASNTGGLGAAPQVQSLAV